MAEDSRSDEYPRPAELEDKLDDIVESGPVDQDSIDEWPRVETQPGGPVESSPGGVSGTAGGDPENRAAGGDPTGV